MIMQKPMNRRMALFIGASLVAGAMIGNAADGGAEIPNIEKWRGIALGADAEIQLMGVSALQARMAFSAIENEIARLEQIFSLYRHDSVLSRLNRDGRIDAPPPELLEVITASVTVHRHSGGLFDPTIQPVFDYYARKASAPWPADRRRLTMPSAAIMDKIGLDKLVFDSDRIILTRPGMALTFNGIAQGYITDSVAAMLRDRGFENLLIDLGEIAAIGSGPRPDGWHVGIRNADTGQMTGDRLVLRDRAIATSALRGTVLDGSGRIGHIFHPRKGFVEASRRQASVVHESATLADAWSTAAILMDDEALASVRATGMEIYA